MKLKYLYFLVFLLPLLAVERWLITLDDFNTNDNFSKFLEIQLCIVYIFSCYKTAKGFGFFSLINLFMITLGLFNFMKIFYSLISNDNYRNVFVILPIDLDEASVQEMIWVYTLFTSLIYISYRFFLNIIKKNYPRKNRSWNYSFKNEWFRIGRAVMFLSLPFVIYRCYIELTYFSGVSFVELYVSGSQSLPIPSYVRILSVFFQVGFMMILGSKPSKKMFFVYAGLYVLTICPNLVIGLRNVFTLTLLTLIWYYVKVFEVKVKIWKFLVPSTLLIFLLQFVAASREGIEIGTSILLLIPLFLTYQSTSMYVLSLYVQNREIIMPHSYPYILDPIIGWLTGADGQSLEVLEKRSALGHQMIYTLSPDAYLGGNSLGTTCVAELYEFGWIGIITGVIVITWAFAKFDLSIKINRYYLLVSFFFSSSMLIAPRSTFFPNFYFLLRYIIVYGLIMLLWIFFKEVFKKKVLADGLQ